VGLGVAVGVGVTGIGVGPAPEPSRAVPSLGTVADVAVASSWPLSPHAPINTTGIIANNVITIDRISNVCKLSLQETEYILASQPHIIIWSDAIEC
jgi:hypothetical protein